MQVQILTPRIHFHGTNMILRNWWIDCVLIADSNCIQLSWVQILANRGDESTHQQLRALFPGKDFLDESGFSLLHRTVLGLNPIELGMLLATLSRSAIDQCDALGRTSLIWAARRGDSSSVFQLLKSGADANKGTATGEHPLQAAIESRNQMCVRCLLENGSETKLRNAQGWLPLHVSCYFGSDIDIVEILLGNRSENIEAISNHYTTPLMLAAQQGHLHIMKYLIARGANLNATNKDGEASLHSVIQTKTSKCLALLLREGADYTLKTKAGETLLHYAAQFGDLTCLETLHNFNLTGIDPDDRLNGVSPSRQMKDLEGLNALQIAEKRSNVGAEWKDMFRKLISGIRHPETKSSLEIIDQTEKFEDALEEQ